MNLPDATLDNFRGPLRDAVRELTQGWRSQGEQAASATAAPPLIEDAFDQLLEAMERSEARLAGDAQPVQLAGRADGEDISELATYALELFDQALQWADRLGLAEVHRVLQGHIVALVRWVGARGGQVWLLEPVVDALAGIANRTTDPGELVALHQAMGEVMDATAPALRQDLEKNNPGRPWRLLLLNRAIVATRSHQPDIMEQAFAVLIEHLPEDAPGFFSQGMEQMDLLNYPPHVREVMNRYYRKWSASRSLH